MVVLWCPHCIRLLLIYGIVVIISGIIIVLCCDLLGELLLLLGVIVILFPLHFISINVCIDITMPVILIVYIVRYCEENGPIAWRRGEPSVLEALLL